MARRRTAHPGVTCYYRPNGSLIAEWTDPDSEERRRQSLTKEGFRTKTEAQKWLKNKSEEIQEMKRRIARGDQVVGVGATWERIEDEFLDSYADDHGQAAADRNERDWLKHWRAFRSERHIRRGGDLNKRHLHAFRSFLARERCDLRSSTRNRILGATKSLLNWARSRDFLRLTSDHIKDTMKPFRVEKRVPRVLSIDEIRKLIKGMRNHDQEKFQSSRADKNAYYKGENSDTAQPRFTPLAPFISLALLTGARPGEVFALKWDDVDFSRKQIRIWGSKTLRERSVPMHDSPLLMGLLQALRIRRGGDIHVCGDWKGGRPRDFHVRQWKRLLKTAELEYFPVKTLRSTCISYVASRSNQSEYLLAERFGHSLQVSREFYRQPIHGMEASSPTVEGWLGISTELQTALTDLQLYVPQVESNTGS